jgi:hypothetical protein
LEDVWHQINCDRQDDEYALEAEGFEQYVYELTKNMSLIDKMNLDYSALSFGYF